MPQVKDAAVIVAGQVFSNSITTNRQTGEFTGRKVLVLVPQEGDEPGFAVVKLSSEEAAVYNPQPYEQIAWYVRNAPYDIKDGPTGMSTRFVREVTPDDLDKLNSGLKAVASSK